MTEKATQADGCLSLLMQELDTELWAIFTGEKDNKYYAMPSKNVADIECEKDNKALKDHYEKWWNIIRLWKEPITLEQSLSTVVIWPKSKEEHEADLKNNSWNNALSA